MYLNLTVALQSVLLYLWDKTKTKTKTNTNQKKPHPINQPDKTKPNNNRKQGCLVLSFGVKPLSVQPYERGIGLRTPLGLHSVYAQDEDGAEAATEGQRMLTLSLHSVPKIVFRMTLAGSLQIGFFKLVIMHICI